ncbi:DUF3429 domain-containing protein [Nitrincola nitratireducens]|uniref:DUF3429 domain-containing protein n=1 Tax=Nitrincola nitratireducens TaxID=1229521 RepID=W9V837_9GAMM|nr:DUF3429 domain-containing protein [Nitrincola nitratireducens]EXJ12247.1 hypothetical protein D791_01136 [Nitrincola nitratireducens]
MLLIKTLGYSGLLPFIYLTYALMTGNDGQPEESFLLFSIYSCLILGFMSGVIWPILYQHPNQNRLALWTVSFPVFSFLSFIWLSDYILLIQTGLFILLRIVEVAEKIDEAYPMGYASLRWQLTSIVSVCHLCVFFV